MVGQQTYMNTVPQMNYQVANQGTVVGENYLKTSPNINQMSQTFRADPMRLSNNYQSAQPVIMSNSYTEGIVRNLSLIHI